MNNTISTPKNIGNIIGAILGATFVLTVIAALAWGSYATYYGLVAKDIRGIDELILTKVTHRLDELVTTESRREQYLIQASVERCMANTFRSERIYKTLGGVAGWHGWREYTDQELQSQTETLLGTCLNSMNERHFTYESIASVQ